MAIKGAFAAGLLKGFDESLTKSIEKREGRMQTLIDGVLDTAKRAAPDYSKTRAELSRAADIGDAFKRDFKISDEEFIALAQTTDVNKLYEDVYKADTARMQTLKTGVTREEIMAGVNLPDDFTLPEGETRESMLAKMFNLRTEALAEEPNPKSEGAQSRSWGKAISKFLMLNPEMSAEEQLKNMKVMGVDVNDLQAFALSQGTKQDVIPGVTRTSELNLPVVDYTDTDGDRTQSKMYSRLTKRVTGADFNNEVQLASYSQANTDDVDVIRSTATNASLAFSELERQIIRTNIGNPAVSGRYGRSDILESIAAGVDSKEELIAVTNRIKSGAAIGVINAAVAEGRELTDEDIQAIINDTPTDTAATPTDTAATPTDTAAAEAVSELPETLKDNVELTEIFNSLTPEEQTSVTEKLTTITDPQVARMILEGEKKAEPSVDEEEQNSVSETSAAATAQLNIENAEKRARSVADITYSDWKKLSRQERKDRGLPVRNIDGVYTDPDAWKPELEKFNAGIMTPPESIGEQERKSAAQFITANNVKILDFLEDAGLTEESSEEDVKNALSSFYRENQDDESIGGYIAGAPMEDIDMISNVFMLALKNLANK